MLEIEMIAPNKCIKSFANAHWDATLRCGSRPLRKRYTP